MPIELTPEAWAQIRYEYEYSDRPVEDICAAHGISSGTLRDRVRRWGWTRRRPPIPRQGPPPAPAPRIEPVPAASLWDFDAASPPVAAAEIEAAAPYATAAPPVETAAAGAALAPDDGAIMPRLQGAAARVLPAIEATIAKLGAGPMPPREMEQTARALGTLTRTLRELNALLSQRQAAAGQGRCADCDDMPEDIDAFRHELARRIDAFVASRTGEQDGGGTEPQGC